MARQPPRQRTRAKLLALLLLLCALGLAAGCAPPQPAPAASSTAVPRADTPTAPPGTPTPDPTSTPFPEAATAVALAAATADEPVGASCALSGTDRSMTYSEAVDLARRSECASVGQLLDANLCNEQTGTWWLGLDAPREGCNPACVVDVAARTAVINWRCTGLLMPTATPEGAPAALPTPLPPTPDAATPEPDLAPLPELALDNAPDVWSGYIERQNAGTQVRYQLRLAGDQVVPLNAANATLLDILADAAWRGAPIALRGAPDPLTGEVGATAVLSIGAPAAEPRNMAPFAFASASSAAVPDAGGTYDAWSAVNGQLASPWCEGREGPGVGEWLQLDFSAPVVISELRLSNGYDQDGFLYESNDQVATAVFRFDDGLSLSKEFAVVRGLQSVLLDPPVTTQSLRLIIEELYPGWEFEDACIGELEVWARPSD